MGVVLSGGQASGSHNVISAIFDYLQEKAKGSTLYGFKGRPAGIMKGKYVELTPEFTYPYRNQLSWTFGKEGTKLEWRWKCQQPPDIKQTTASILDFLMDANIHLSEDVRKTQSFERLKGEAEKCLLQSEKFRIEKTDFESAVYSKFEAVLNSKKAKLRELRDRVSKIDGGGKAPKVEEEESSGKTESYNENTYDEKVE